MDTAEGGGIKLDDNGFSLGQKSSPHMSQLILEVIRTKGKPHGDDRRNSADLLYLIIQIFAATSLSRVHNNCVQDKSLLTYRRKAILIFCVS